MTQLWSIGGGILTEEAGSARRNPPHSDTLSTTNLKWTSAG